MDDDLAPGVAGAGVVGAVVVAGGDAFGGAALAVPVGVSAGLELFGELVTSHGSYKSLVQEGRVGSVVILVLLDVPSGSDSRDRPRRCAGRRSRGRRTERRRRQRRRGQRRGRGTSF